MNPPLTANHRLISLDVMRGMIMVLLAAESCQLYESLQTLSEGSWWNGIVQQFFHHPWNGLRFWDLVQPAFMTMAGTAMYIAFSKRSEKGITWRQQWRHILVRCFRLLLCALILHSIQAGKLVWELWNVLAQLAVTTLIAYLIIQKSAVFQLVVTGCLLLVTEMAYRFILVPGYDQPFTEHHNFGTYMDLVLMGKTNTDGWVAINFIPTAAHTIWGCLVGRLLLSKKTAAEKMRMMIIAGLTGLITGYGLDWAGVTPIIKRTATSSFVLVSGGWVLLITAFIFWLIDLKQQNRQAWIPVVVGMNSLFIYMVFETVGHQWVNHAVAIFVEGALGFTGLHTNVIHLFTALVTLLGYWYLCFWLFRRKIFFKI